MPNAMHWFVLNPRKSLRRRRNVNLFSDKKEKKFSFFSAKKKFCVKNIFFHEKKFAWNKNFFPWNKNFHETKIFLKIQRKGHPLFVC